MANKIYPFTIPAEYIYDTSKILVDGGIVSLKEDLNNVYARWHLNEETGETVIDSSGNGRDGTPINNPVSVVGKLNTCLSFNGINQTINYGNIAGFERTDKFSFEAWFKTTDNGDYRPFFGKNDGNGYIFYLHTGEVRFYAKGVSDGYIMVHTSNTFNDNNWHQAIMTYNGNSSPSGIHIYVDGVNRSLSTLHDNLASSILNSGSLITGNFSTRYYNGLFDDLIIYDKELSQEEVTYRYNSGTGRENNYPADKPTIKPTTSWEVSGLSQFTAFVESLGGGNQGNLAYQLSDDEGVNWRYWNGSSWAVTSDQYNDVSTVHTNIGSFPVTNEKIMFRAFLISDGEQQCELDTLEFIALVGDPPVVYAGADKNCYDHETKKPFEDATISDPDGDIENATAYRKIESGVYTQILKGEYGTSQEAIRNFQYTFDNLGVIACELKVIDEAMKESTDSMNMTISKYHITFNIKDTDGNHLGNILCDFDDGEGWQLKNSPFLYEFEYKTENYKCTFDKTGFISQSVDVPPTTHIENITMQRLTVDPSAIADAVWDELKSGHISTNSFGKEVQDTKSETDKIQTVDDNVDLVKNETDKIQTIDSNIDDIKINADKIPNIETLIKRVLGLSQENYKLCDIIYAAGQLQQAKIKTYPTSADLQNDTNVIATYQIDCTFNTDGTYKDYKVRKL